MKPRSHYDDRPPLQIRPIQNEGLPGARLFLDVLKHDCMWLVAGPPTVMFLGAHLMMPLLS
jgi:hypothetical protein